MSTVYESKEYDQFCRVIVRRTQDDGTPTPGGNYSYYTGSRPGLKPDPRPGLPLNDHRRFKWVPLG